MKFNLLNLSVTAAVLSALCFGCNGVEHQTGTGRMGSATRSTAGDETPIAAAAKPKKKVTLDIDNGTCMATFDEHTNGTVRKGTLAITVGAGTGQRQCQTDETDGPQSLTINGKRVVDIGPAQFTTEGSCRYCYINSSGGMSCVVYNVPSCP